MTSTSLPSEHRLTGTVSAGVAALSGDFSVWTLARARQLIGDARQVDLAGLTRFDTAAALLLLSLQDQGVTLQGLAPTHERLLEAVRKSVPTPDPAKPVLRGLRALLDSTGRRVVRALRFLTELAEYLGRFLAALARSIRHPSEFPLIPLVHHCQETGLRAVPIVALMSFLIGVVLAFQGAVQLREFGAEVFVVDLISISIIRELGVLLTAIIVAGRTASALTASIGSMKMREEIDAMRTLGIDPDMRLVLPRILALLITLPILTVIANAAGLLGGAIMSWVELGISPSMFRYRMIAETDVDNVIAGLSKAPVFALIIGVIGCHAGMKVGKDAESLGAQTSTAVVNAIFLVIIADALFSIFFAEVGI